MKKIFVYIFVLTCLVFADCDPIKPIGKGTHEDPFLFAQIGNFAWFANNYKKIEHGPIVYCVQVNDIDATKSKDWWRFPIMRTDDYILNYDGQGYSINNLCMGWCDNETGGLFTEGVFQLKNINLIEAEKNRYENNVGLLVGKLYAGKGQEAFVRNCHVQGKTTYWLASAFIGKLTVGKGGKIEISDCSVDAEIKDGPAGLITTVNNHGTLTIKNTSIKCQIDYNIDPLSWGGDVKTAGFINQILLYKGSKTNIEDCYSDVDINIMVRSAVASGFIGELFNQDHRERVDVAIKRCYSTGTINKTNGYATASFLSIVDNLYTNEETIIVKDCYYNSTSFKKGDKYALPKTEEEMKQLATFENWDFENVWDIDEGETMPYFISELPEPCGLFALLLLPLLLRRNRN